LKRRRRARARRGSGGECTFFLVGVDERPWRARIRRQLTSRGKGPIGASLGAVGQLAMGRGDSGCHLGWIIPLGDFGSLSRVGVHYVNCLVV
jgi:hypothetical protein